MGDDTHTGSGALETSGVSVSFAGLVALEDVTLRLQRRAVAPPVLVAI